MTLLSPKGLHAVEEIAHRTGFSQDAVTSMLFSIVSGRGGMAQFSHPEFGGSGQWMAGGAIMISDMFNNGLKARVDALCNELSALIRSESDFVAAAAFQSQSQGANGNLQRRSSSLLEAAGPDQSNWWPADLGGKVTVYDTQDHQISGFSQQQPGSGSLTFSSQLGGVDVSRLPAISGVNGTKTSPEPMHKGAAEQEAATSKSSGRHEDILTAIERLAELHARGILTEAEFSAKKAELLGRL
jgi:hypothetical protein